MKRPPLNVPLKTAIVSSLKSQEQIARRARMSAWLLSRFVRGHRDPSPDERARIAKAVGLPIHEVFPGEEESHAE